MNEKYNPMGKDMSCSLSRQLLDLVMEMGITGFPG